MAVGDQTGNGADDVLVGVTEDGPETVRSRVPALDGPSGAVRWVALYD